MHNKGFSYKYSAPTERERREIESIRRQYTVADSESDKLARLRRLHSRILTTATAVSLTLGILGTLIFGAGFSLVLEFGQMTVGCILSAVGIPLVLSAYPIYIAVLNAKKKKHREEILRLSDELLNTQNEYGD